MIRFFGVVILSFALFARLSEAVMPLAIFYSLITPFLGILFLGCLLLEIKNKQKGYLIFVLIYIVGVISILSATLQYSITSKTQKSFSIMSYNVSVFNVYAYLNHDYLESRNLMNWIKQDSTDIYCFQEYYNCDTLMVKENPDKLFTINKKLGTQQGYQVYAPPFLTNHIGATFGLAIFSKFPIIHAEKIDFKHLGGSTTNGLLIADLKIPNQDTLRIINCHLQSIILDNGEPIKNSFIEKCIASIQKIHNGAIIRSKQIDLLTTVIKKSPHPVIVCGDFNESSYGYAYNQLQKLLSNGFESKGTGFGFTLTTLPFRIDQLFFDDERLNIESFETNYSQTYSDHYPISARLSFKN
ncbi:endonuclease/exonuclease/phosphatase family protein [Flammeovirga kamogawensis]|uniref:Endonuclease/exonuclease/phosphatase family protein n=1 Tax=Flammeovirga kamogawensis TaxID=373891 RepID=A0ABX8GPX2_9BACT|nr:endonuclease/exonuclease/phosphatase family protein [Flammeovirga kamogawensis]MBB6463424.1 endonuclease/exonuclease/phosphatase family metal-dependent hydrolase [Flammeovirga kamogawensis]QWG05649.1 endonuclease/exonuclease/phosphatase family protein [Flammeovirga kamogawensis]TRX67480.1 endonuclease/exonuclease/phosphatase family protein [Flammeovirga kamogawensis]